VRMTTKELSVRTWPDFEELFTRGSGHDFCACMLFQRGRHLPRSAFPSRAAMQIENLAQKRGLVRDGRAHGILVYADGEVVGWCQYGPVDELPIGGRGRPGPTNADWRITCLVTDKAYRNRGVSRRALRTALASIRRRGGGVVESYPVVWETDERLQRDYPDCKAVEVGLANTRYRGAYQQLGGVGTVTMLAAEGFEPVRTYDDRRLVMQLTV
jgi:GNAT superfamily N-acetyltransferase